jgi:hypothetical protein
MTRKRRDYSDGLIASRGSWASSVRSLRFAPIDTNVEKRIVLINKSVGAYDIELHFYRQWAIADCFH